MNNNLKSLCGQLLVFHVGGARHWQSCGHDPGLILSRLEPNPVLHRNPGLYIVVCQEAVPT